MTILDEDFHKHLRSTLNHLYDPDFLRSSVLASLLGIGDRFNTPNTLQEILFNAIEDLKKRPSGPLSTPPLFLYDLLYYRYIQKLNQKEVSNQLGISIRQLAREQDRAIDLLAEYLLEQYPKLTENPAKPAHKTKKLSQGENGNLISEITWLEKESNYQPVQFKNELDTVLTLVSPLVSQHHIQIDIDLEDCLPDLEVHPVALRQVLLYILNAAIHHAREAKIQIKSKCSGNTATFIFSTSGIETASGKMISPTDQNSLEMATRLIEKYKGSLKTKSSQNSFQVFASLPTSHHHMVLLIDDNEDFHQLVQRYVFNTHYQVICTENPDEAIDLAERHAIQLILLDVMMPEIDGWQVLSQLRRNPKTSHIPVIICSIITQDELAYSLGASASLRKPISREMLVETLDRLIGPAEPASG